MIRQRSYFFLQGIIEHGCQFFLAEIAAAQVGPADIAHKQRIAGENRIWITVSFAQQVTGRFDGMTRGMQYFDGQAAQFENFSVFGPVDRERSFGFRAVYDRCSGSLCQIEMTAHKISMEMGLEIYI